MKTVLTDEQVLVYSSTEENNISIATLHKGDAMELGKVTKKNKKTWVEITLPGNQKGYIPGDTKIFTIRKAQLASKSVDMMDAPSRTANLVKTYTKGATFDVVFIETTDNENWFKLVDQTGQSGYILTTGSKLRVVQESTKSSALRNIITGLIFTVIGVVMTFLNSNDPTGTSLVYVSYAVIFFGLLQIGQGAVEYYKVIHSKDKPKD